MRTEQTHRTTVDGYTVAADPFGIDTRRELAVPDENAYQFFHFEEGFGLAIGAMEHQRDATVRRITRHTCNFHFRLTGQGEIALEDGSNYAFGRQSLGVFMTPPGVELAEHYFKGQHEQSVTVFCQPEFILTRLPEVVPRLPLAMQAYLRGELESPIYDSAVLSADMSLAVRSMLESKSEPGMKRLLAAAKALELLVLALDMLMQARRIEERGAYQTDPRDVERINQICRILDAEFVSPPPISKLARLAAVNEAKLMHLFKQRTGETIFNYTHRLRMEHAKRLLETTSISVTEIAFDVGYGFSSNFTTAFGRHFGVTPKAAREAARR